MDSNWQDSSDTKAEFRKPPSDAARRRYRKRSPSSSSDGSPQREHDDRSVSKISEDKLKKDDGRELNRDRGNESYKYPDRQSSRSYNRHDTQSRHDRHVNDYDRGHSKSSYHSGRDPRDIGHSRGEKDPRYRDYPNDADKHSWEKSDASGSRSRDKIPSNRSGYGRRHGNAEVRDREDRTSHREDKGRPDRKIDLKSSVDQKIDRSSHYDDKDESYSRRDESDSHLKEASQIYSKAPDRVKNANEEKRKRDDRVRCTEQRNRDPEEHSTDVIFSKKDDDSKAKKPKLSGFESVAPETNGSSEKAYVTDSDIDAAKVAAMRAAELVNKNLIGTGYMSTDQKKKLLWGNKKSTASEEPARHWNSANFGDHERQEKFNKLMGVKGDTKVERKLDDPNAEKQREQLQLELEKQYTAGLRRKDGRTVGLGL